MLPGKKRLGKYTIICNIMSFLDGKIYPVDILLLQKDKKKKRQNKVRIKHLLEHENGLL